MAYTASAAAARALVARSTLRPVASQISAAKMDMASTPGRTRTLWSKTEKKHRQNSHLMIHFPTSEGVSEVSERANE